MKQRIRKYKNIKIFWTFFFKI